MEALAPFTIFLKKANLITTITTDFLPYIKTFSEDPSWRIRLGLAKNYGTLSQAFTAAEVSSDIFPAFTHLVLDPEPDVRTLAVQELFPFLAVVGTSQFIAELAPVAVQLADDPVNTVRKLLSELCVDVAAKVGPEAVANHLSDLIINKTHERRRPTRSLENY